LWWKRRRDHRPNRQISRKKPTRCIEQRRPSLADGDDLHATERRQIITMLPRMELTISNTKHPRASSFDSRRSHSFAENPARKFS